MCTQLLNSSRRHTTRAFSLIELVIVVIIIAIIGAIAVPRMSSSAENAAKNAVIGDQSSLQKAIDLYTIEHEGQLPHVGDASVKQLYLHLIETSDQDGTLNASGIYGPYINGIPTNKINGLATIRKDGASAGANTHGWRYDTVSGQIEPDHTSGSTGYKAESKSIENITEDLIKSFDG